MARHTAPSGSRAEILKDLRLFCDRSVPGVRFKIRMLRSNDFNDAPPVEGYQGEGHTEIQIPVSSEEYCCMSGPSDAIAFISDSLLPDRYHPKDLALHRDQDQSTDPEFS